MTRFYAVSINFGLRGTENFRRPSRDLEAMNGAAAPGNGLERMTTEMSSSKTRSAAFYDVDGTLIKTNVVHAYAYYAINAPRLTDRLARTAGLLASLPAYWVADKYDRKLFNDAFYKNYAGFSEDRLVVLGEEVFKNVIKPNIFDGARDLIARSRAQGHAQVLVTGAIDYVTKPLAEYLGVDHWVANRLEIKDELATGRLIQPMLAGANKAAWVRRYAEQNFDIDAITDRFEKTLVK